METKILTREQARPVVEYVEGELREKNPGLTFYVAGAWRRGAELIDSLPVVIKCKGVALIDAAGNPTVNLPPALEHFQESGAGIWEAHLRTPYGFIRVEFVMTKPEQMAATLWWKTGPDDLWETLKNAAALDGYVLNSTGLWMGGQQVDDGSSEYAIVRKFRDNLFLGVVDPAKREAWEPYLRQLLRSTQRIARIEEIPSSRPPHTIYQVWVDGDGRAFRCECPAFTYRGICRHLEKAEVISARLGAVPVEDRV
jgi:DNA polymerase/3'-5' exonuclease PolX